MPHSSGSWLLSIASGPIFASDPMNANTYSVTTRKPADCSSAELKQFEALVLRGAEVIPAGLRGRIGRSACLAWAHDGLRTVAVAALKRPHAEYRETVFRKSGTPELPAGWETELGWIYVHEEHRRKGLARRLIQVLLDGEPGGGIFATTRELNDPIMPLLKEFGFLREGNAFVSSNGDYNILLHVRRA